MAAAAEGSKGGFSLGKTFNKVVWEGLKLVTIGVAAAVAWQVFLDPIFFPILHDAGNLIAQGWVNMIHSHFSFIPDAIGFTGDGGLLKTEFAQNILKPYMPTPIDPNTLSMSMGIDG